MDLSIERARENGYVETIMGRRRNLPDINSTNATVRGYAEKVFNTVAWPMPNVEEALELLAGIAPLYIVTAGPQDVQQFRIDHLPFKDKFAGFYNPNQGRSQGAVIGGVDLYVSDVGEHKLTLNRYMRSSVLFGIDPEYVSVAMLDGIKMENLAKTGDADKRAIVGEGTLAVTTSFRIGTRIIEADADLKREQAASQMGFSAYGVTQSDDPLSQAMRGLIDNAATHEHQIAMLWQAIEKLSEQRPDCVPSDAARRENFEADKLNQMVGK
jgi:hypothetical protein